MFKAYYWTDGRGNLLVAKLRDRSRIRNGISVRSKSYADDPKVWEIAEKINDRMHFQSACFFQLKKNARGEYRLLEISPRMPGTMGLSRNMVISFPGTVTSREYSTEWRPGEEPYSPINNTHNNILYQKYKSLADQTPNVIFGGRLGEYKYYNMDVTILATLEIAKGLLV